MRNNKGVGITGILTFFLVAVFIILYPIFESKAGALTAAYLYLSRIEANINGSAETVEYILAITPSQTIPTGGTVTLSFPDADDGMWCRTNGTLNISGITSSAVDLTSTNWFIDAALPGTLAATCTKGTSIGSVDTIVISGVTALTGGTTYGVKLTNGTTAGVIGTDDTVGDHEITVEVKNGSTIDSSTFKVNLIANDTVVVSATVSSIPSVGCSISSNAVNIGSLYPGGSYSSATHTIGTITADNTGGYYWAVYGTGDGSTDAGLWKSTTTTHLIPSTGSATIDLRGVGVEGFGMTVSDPDTAGSAVVSTDFVGTTPGVFGALDRGPAGAQLLLYQNGSQTTTENATVTYGAKAGASATAGSYSESVIFVCGGYF